MFSHLCVVYNICSHCKHLQLAEPSPDSAGVGGETEQVGDHKATTPSGFSNIDAIEITAAGIVSCFFDVFWHCPPEKVVLAGMTYM